MKLLLMVPVYIVQLALCLTAYWALSLILYIFVGPYMPGYYEDSGLRDANAILVTLLLWDRYFGPYSSLLRGVAKYLNAAKDNQRDD